MSTDVRSLMMTTGMVLKMSVSCRHLIAQEDFIEFSHCESSRTYIIVINVLYGCRSNSNYTFNLKKD